jgi:hypothetical protein
VVQLDVASRFVVAGLLLGVPSYWVGIQVYEGRKFSRRTLAIGGGILTAAATLLIGSVIPLLWLVALIAVVEGAIASVWVPLLPQWQSSLRTKLRR